MRKKKQSDYMKMLSSSKTPLKGFSSKEIPVRRKRLKLKKPSIFVR